MPGCGECAPSAPHACCAHEPRDEKKNQAPAQPGAEYVCPMHPEIVRSEPGSCPICGMALEPRTVTLEEEPNPELVDMQRRFWVSLALTVLWSTGLMYAGVWSWQLTLALLGAVTVAAAAITGLADGTP